MSKKKRFDINDFQDGLLAEKIADAWEAVLENMQDPNRPFKPKRKITITLTLEQSEKRNAMIVIGEVATKLALEDGVAASFAAGTDLKTGEVWSEEYKPIDARQLSVNDFTIAEDGEILDDPLAVEKILNMNDRLAR